MQEPFKFCPACGQQNNLSAQFCQRCGAQYSEAPPQWAAPPRPKRTGPLKILSSLIVVVFGCCIVSGIIGSLRNKTTPSIGVTLTSSPTPTPSPTPDLPPSELLARAKTLLARPYDKSAYDDAFNLLNRIPLDAAEYKESIPLKQRITKARAPEEAARKREEAERERQAILNDPFRALTVVKTNWEKGGFGAVAIWRVTFKNISDRPIGNIQYRTAYYSETGNLVDKGGVDSLLGKKIIQKVIPPRSTRTIEVNDGFTHSEAHRARFELVDCQFVADSR